VDAAHKSLVVKFEGQSLVTYDATELDQVGSSRPGLS
jgi:hypothetical protein